VLIGICDKLEQLGDIRRRGFVFNEDCIAWTTSTNPEGEISLDFVHTIENDGNNEDLIHSCPAVSNLLLFAHMQ
jgi:hypothetical protein